MGSIQSEMDDCRREYEKQRRLERFVGERPLKRPKIKKWHVVLLFLVFPVLIALSVRILVLLPVSIAIKILVFALLLLMEIELYIRFCFLQAVRCYQHYAKDEVRRRCMCVPSCSEYATICLRKIFPLAVALIKIRIRLKKICKGGECRLDFPFKKMNAEFERMYLQ